MPPAEKLTVGNQKSKSGGARPNAGRKPGQKNRATVLRENFAAEGLSRAMADGVSPLEVLLTVMRGGPKAEGITDRQFAAAKEAAPYVHPKLAATTLDATFRRDPSNMTDEELAAVASNGGQ